MNKKENKKLQGIKGLALMAVLVFAVQWACGQQGPTGTDYTGIYYIANCNEGAYDLNNTAGNYYLCPSTNLYASDQPFLTTYKTNRGSDSRWQIEYAKTEGGKDYYHLIHLSESGNRYLVFNDKILNNNVNRLRVHLQSSLSSVENDNLFYIAANDYINGSVMICPYSSSTNSKKSLNPAKGNQNYYEGHPYNNSENVTWNGVTFNCGGLIGYYGLTESNGSVVKNSAWFLEPEVDLDLDMSVNNMLKKVNINLNVTASAHYYQNFEIYYAINEIPTSSSSHGNSPLVVDVAGHYGTVYAMVAMNGVLITNTLESIMIDFAVLSPPVISMSDDCENLVSMASASSGTNIRYTTDGSTPLPSSPVYVQPFATGNTAVIKAKAFRGMNQSETTTQTINRTHTIAPTITFDYSAMQCILSGDGTIYYTLNGNDPDVSSSVYSAPITIPQNATFQIKARAKSGTMELSCVVEKSVTLTNVINSLSSLQSIAGSNNSYIIVDDINASGLTNSIANFSGTLEAMAKEDGTFYTISGLTKPLFSTLDGATVKNLTFSGVNITGGTNVGAICEKAKGTTNATRIYNCGVLSGTVKGTGCVGSLVGLIESGTVRVVNCYSYADVSGTTGTNASNAAGIVGKNEGAVSSNGTVGNVRIALCMMYGNVTGATNISPVYGGNHVDNVGKFTEYNYWRYRSGLQYTDLNDQLPVEEDEYLTRFPFFRHILNSHRELAAFFLFGGVSCNNVGDINSANIAEMGHWVLKKDVAAFPIIEPWPTNTQTTPTATNNNLPSTTDDYAGKLLTSMGTNGYLSVSVKIGNNTYPVSLPITDMDTLNYDFTWGKVMLPFANEFEVNTDYTRICTGWKITGITGGTAGTFENYNVSDRNCTNKDLYSTTGFIFAQGGNYIVPYDVTGIEITANFATAYYLRDENYEIVYSGTPSGNNTAGYIGRAGRAGATPTQYHGQPVYNTMNDALGAMTHSGSVHEQAVVLVGNYHWDGEAIVGDTLKRGYTIMSIDADNNQEPDYALYSNHTTNRPPVPPTRYDFIAMIPLGMSSYLHGSVFYPNIPIWKPRGWFEITETSFTRASQFEIESSNFNSSSDQKNYRCIINGGYFTQMVRSFNAACTKLKYYQIGGKAYIKEFYPGNHSDRSRVNTLVPVNVTGGEIEQCFMTGYGKGIVYGPNIYFWCAGGRIHKFLGAYMEPPVQTSSGTSSNPGTVNLTAKIDHARIYRFFGGGTTSKARITGNINVTVNNSFVDFYCGGPEFGDMVTGENGKTITTTADHTTFREYYGAGFGGTAITYTNDEDKTMVFNEYGASTIIADGLSYPNEYFGNHYLDQADDVGRLDYKTGYGIGNCYKYEYIMHSRGHASVARFYTGYAMFSLAKAGSVTNTLTNCTVEGSFYGGGCQGTVDGTVSSTLTDCTILQSAFGGGYKAESNQVMVYTTTQTPQLSTYYGESGLFSDFGSIPTPDTYTWEQGTNGQNNVAVEAEHTLYTGTDVTLTYLGNVTGDIKITLKGNTTVNGSVFGGGNESKSLSNTLVEILDHTKVYGNIYGGGNEGEVRGNTKVIVNGKPDDPSSSQGQGQHNDGNDD